MEVGGLPDRVESAVCVGAGGREDGEGSLVEGEGNSWGGEFGEGRFEEADGGTEWHCCGGYVGGELVWRTEA